MLAADRRGGRDIIDMAGGQMRGGRVTARGNMKGETAMGVIMKERGQEGVGTVMLATEMVPGMDMEEEEALLEQLKRSTRPGKLVVVGDKRSLSGLGAFS